MIKVVIFDLFETLITEWVSDKYTSAKCATDLGVDNILFREVWESLHTQMYTGTCTYENALMKICEAAGKSLTPDKLALCSNKRHKAKAQCFSYRHDDIVKMLESLRLNGIKLAMCSNCFSEEADTLRESVLCGYFDAVILSYETGYAKPDERIYRLCTDRLGVNPSECIYVGDGGSRELYGADAVGMKPVRAMWFLNRYESNVIPMPFEQVSNPCEVIKLCMYK